MKFSSHGWERRELMPSPPILTLTMEAGYTETQATSLTDK